MPPASQVLRNAPAIVSEQDADVEDVIDVSSHVNADGVLAWTFSAGVWEIATVIVNRVPVETIWRAPFVTRIDRQLHAGENTIEVQVTNLWPNRIIGDLQPSSTVHYTQTNNRSYTKDSPLLPSGLLAPVTVELRSEQRLQ